MNLATTYLGMSLPHPLVAGAGPLTGSLEGIERLAEAGVAAVIMPSLFEEQIEQESTLLDLYGSYGSESFAEAMTLMPAATHYALTTDHYLSVLSRASQSLEIPVIASLNGATPGGWTDYAISLEQAGAAALELNLYNLPTDPEVSAQQVEDQYLETVRLVTNAVKIPVAVKLSPFFSAPANMARRLVSEGGVKGLVLFNRFYQPDFDLDHLTVVSRLVLSSSDDLRLPMTWVAILFGRVQADLAITGGVHTYEDVIKSVLAGASITQMTSELLRHGSGRIGQILAGLKVWLEEREYDSLAQMRGSLSQQHAADPAAFERHNYMKVLHSWSPDPTGVAPY